jgi:DNA transposition AAA+ family ATPase
MEETAKVIPITSADVRPSVDEAMARDGLSQTLVARESGLSAATISQYLAGTYKGSVAAVERKLAKWLTSRDRRTSLTATAIREAEFFEGPAAMKIMATLEYAQQAGDMASVIGAPGTGKTRTANEYAARNPNCWIATITPSSANVAMTLTEICDVIGIHPENFRGARSMAQIIRMRIRGTHGLLIVDEAQHLTLPAIEEIRSIHDATGIGIALLGSYAFQARVSHERLQARTAQIMSRLGMRISIARPNDEDVEAMLDAWHITGKKERDFLKRLAAGAGALRNVAKTIRLAGLAAAGAKESLQFKHLEDARAALDGE